MIESTAKKFAGIVAKPERSRTSVALTGSQSNGRFPLEAYIFTTMKCR